MGVANKTSKTIASAFALLLAALPALASSNPPLPTPEPSLARALALWRVEPGTLDIKLRWEALSPCRINREDETATTQLLTSITTTVFDSEDGEPPAKAQTESYQWVIRLNLNCNWERIDLDGILTHEVGHILLGTRGHSKDPHSIMFKAVIWGAQQVITDEDWAATRCPEAKK